ncbi:hypothetical protein G9A89_021701, partial [Geosiphon pyriformis]
QFQDMSVDECWTTLRRKQSLAYPYSPQRSIFPEESDFLKHDARRLFISFVSLGKKLLNSLEPPRDRDNMENITRMIRIMEDGVDFGDLEEFFDIFNVSSSRTSAVIVCQEDFTPHYTLDWEVLRQVVILHRISPNKAAVYCYVLINTGVIDVFAMGPTIRFTCLGIFGRVLPDVAFSFAYRFQIPRSFENDVLMMAFIFAIQLHNHGKYLHLTQSVLNLYKLEAFGEFQEIHDKWLGNVTSGEEYPFIVKRSEEEVFIDEGGKLTEKGWILVDVPGDGNCGFFSLILGLENNNNKAYNPLHVDAYGDPFDATSRSTFDLKKNGRNKQFDFELT